MFLFLCQDMFEDALGGGVAIADVVDHLAVAVDRNALGDEVFLDHVAQVLARFVLGVRALCQRVGIEVWFPAELHDAFGDLVGVLMFLLRVFEEFGLDRVGEHARRHEVMPVIAQHADPFRRQRFVQQLDDGRLVGAVGLGDRTSVDVLAGIAAQGGDVGEAGSAGIACGGRLFGLAFLAHVDLQQRIRESATACTRRRRRGIPPAPRHGPA